MKIYQKLVIGLFSGYLMQNVFASSLELCVFDVMGANGDTMAVAKDYALAAKQWGVSIQPKVYTNLNAVIADFDQKKCGGIVADNYATKKYNPFMGTVGAVGAIPNYDIAHKVMTALSSPKLATKLKNKNYEVVGYMPFGLAYFFTKDRNLDSLEKLNGKKLGVLEMDPSQRRIAQKVGMRPVNMTFDNAAVKFRNGDFDVVPAPLIVYEPFEMEKIIGDKGGVANYPLGFLTMNFVLATGDYPTDFGQKSRQWFAQRMPQLMKTVERWDATVPRKVMYDIPAIDRSSYDRLLSQMRKEFIDNKTYDYSMITLINHLRCNQEPNFIECKK